MIYARRACRTATYTRWTGLSRSSGRRRNSRTSRLPQARKTLVGAPSARHLRRKFAAPSAAVMRS
eukprot:3869143-Pleurochrysis_carterae.AAC.1